MLAKHKDLSSFYLTNKRIKNEKQAKPKFPELKTKGREKNVCVDDEMLLPVGNVLRMRDAPMED